MDIRNLRYFVTVAEALSFAKAARDLHMSQPPLSKRIADMERELGVRLFNRSSKKVALTAAGQSLLPQARAAVQAFDSVVNVARRVLSSQLRCLRIALPPETSRSELLDVVNRLRRENVQVNISEAGTSEQQRLPDAGEVDIGLLHHPFDTCGLGVSEPLAQSLGCGCLTCSRMLSCISRPMSRPASFPGLLRCLFLLSAPSRAELGVPLPQAL
ncbi:DNA-binding transcriptional LysR family regulator [Bradyrhizobium sp. IAR9]|uniref:LysR family transcriptional regulator n=1 Tax=Bradyrhizobium sp. IAR9 TaxID=2663841 RepID=UPI0015CBE6A7|nr:LysR family transcriptional regulator [Bradyrhizobium sp. IAR9]NYG45366.1 DNA-binding transcriptional LysR family regulator [Bradyrhizobium sp. IAR9]